MAVNLEAAPEAKLGVSEDATPHPLALPAQCCAGTKQRSSVEYHRLSCVVVLLKPDFRH
jgi:hypothetical protein